MENYSTNLESIFDFSDSPILGIGNTSANEEGKVDNWLQESSLQSIFPISNNYNENRGLTSLDNGETHFLSQSVQEAGIASQFHHSISELNLDLDDLLNHNIPSPSVSSVNDTTEVMGIQNTIPCNGIPSSCDAHFMSSGSSSPDLQSVSSHLDYLNLTGPSSVQSASCACYNDHGPVKSERKQQQRKIVPKKKMYEFEEPFDDPAEERKRLNAIKAHRNRQNKCGFFSHLEKENNMLKSTIAERDMLIAHLKKTINDLNNTSSSQAAKFEEIKMLL